MLASVQLVTDKSNGQLPDAAKIKALGVIVRPITIGDSLAISPPLTISCEQLDTLVTFIEHSLDILSCNCILILMWHMYILVISYNVL